MPVCWATTVPDSASTLARNRIRRGFMTGVRLLSGSCSRGDRRRRGGWRRRCRIDGLPVLLHIDDRPFFLLRLVEGLVEFADMRRAVIRPLASRVRVVDNEPEARALAGCGPLQHLPVAIGIAERGDRAAADERLDTRGLAR